MFLIKLVYQERKVYYYHEYNVLIFQLTALADLLSASLLIHLFVAIGNAFSMFKQV